MSDETRAYTLTRRRHQRRLILRVRPDGAVTVSAPIRTPQREIDAFVASKAEWIRRQQVAVSQSPPRIVKGSAQFDEARLEIVAMLDTLMPLWCERMGVEQAPRVTIKAMTTRWGSCNARLNTINLNVELARRGARALEYVLVHELAHLFHQNHGPGFYALMNATLADWQERRTELRAAPQGLQ